MRKIFEKKRKKFARDRSRGPERGKFRPFALSPFQYSRRKNPAFPGSPYGSGSTHITRTTNGAQFQTPNPKRGIYAKKGEKAGKGPKSHKKGEL